MLFNTIDFALFLPVVVLFYFSLPHRYRWILLLAASYFFYMSWKVEYAVLIMISTLVDYTSGIWMERLPGRRSRLPLLILSLCTNLGLLFFFKYFNFAAENINLFMGKVGIDRELPLMNFLLPVGISFYTFQTLSYTIEVFYGRQRAERHLGYFAVYVSFFPQLVAGPIERYSRLAPQFRQKHVLNYSDLVNGLRLVLYGLFIKMVIADNLAVVVDKVYATPEAYASIDILKGIFFYSFQIYSDFFGYSTIAIGSARIMGIRIMDNFKTPYLSRSITEFWQRWHISLSTWFRDYLYFPLGGNRVKKFRWALNILIVFVVSGIWHGANWTFLIWGGIFGLFYLAEKWVNTAFGIRQLSGSITFKQILLVIKTFSIVTFAWVFFRSQDFGEALALFSCIIKNAGLEQALSIPVFLWVFLGLFVVSDIVLYNKRFDTWLEGQSSPFRWFIYGVLLFGIIVFAGVENFPFIYFQF